MFPPFRISPHALRNSDSSAEADLGSQWYNSLSPSVRDKDLSRLALFSMHHKYFERDYLQVVEAGCELIRGQVKEQSEVIDLVLRAAVKCDVAVQRRPEVLALAQRWHEYVSVVFDT